MGELSGDGSTEITTVVPLTSKGNVCPSGAALKKSSPGIGGPALLAVPLNGLPLSAVVNEVNVPVEIGPAAVTTHPSYTQPSGSVGNVNDPS